MRSKKKFRAKKKEPKKKFQKMLWMIVWIFVILCNIGFVHTRDVILSSGLLNWDREQLVQQYNLYQFYHDMHIISSTSILVYNINEKGELDTYTTNDSVVDAETYQQSLKQNIGLRAYPCIYCDEQSGFCTGLNKRLDHLFANNLSFVLNVTTKVRLFHWDAITIDFEPVDTIDWIRLTRLLIYLSETLFLQHVRLFVWVSQATLYDVTLYRAPNIYTLSMDTYTYSYLEFVQSATWMFQKTNNLTHIGFGLLSSNNIPEQDMAQIALWVKVAHVPFLSIWSDHVSPLAFKALHLFLAS